MSPNTGECIHILNSPQEVSDTTIIFSPNGQKTKNGVTKKKVTNEVKHRLMIEWSVTSGEYCVWYILQYIVPISPIVHITYLFFVLSPLSIYDFSLFLFRSESVGWVIRSSTDHAPAIMKSAASAISEEKYRALLSSASKTAGDDSVSSRTR